MNRVRWIAAAAAVLVLGLGAWFLWSHPAARSHPAPVAGSDALAAPAPVGTVETYSQNMTAALAPLRQALDSQDDAALLAAAGALRPELMALVVPADRRDDHLALVLAVSDVVQAGQDNQTDLASVRTALTAALKPFAP